jgi:long-chain acyl-CoA synthetase
MEGTIAEAWRDAVSAEHLSPPFLGETSEGWRAVGWNEAAARVDALAAGFAALGVRKGDRVAILSRTRLEWTLCDFALATLGAVSVPIYQTSSREECAHILADSGARAIVCEDSAHLERVAGLERELPALEHLIVIDPAPGALALGELEKPGSPPAHSVAPSDVLTLIYTSGTTGPPKGCVLTHANFVAELEAISHVRGLFVVGDTILLFLPLAHNFARLIQYCGVRLGLTLAFCAEPARLPEALREVRPTILPGVPRVFEKVHASVRAGFEAETGLKRRVVDWSLAVGGRRAARRQRGEPLSVGLAAQTRLADRLVFSKINERLGGRLRIAISGGAPLAREVMEFFAACDLLILEGYGLSETTSGCAVNRPDAYRFGTVGLPLPGVQLAIADDGEVLARGETIFQGYHGRPEETADAFTEDGWLLTGDIGAIDADGFLAITDRKKELIVTAGGKKIPPQNLENALKTFPYIADALVVGDRRPYVAALIAVDPEEVARIDGGGVDVHALVAGAVEDVNARLGRAEQIKRFSLLPRPFSVEAGELTPTLKVKRRVCEQRFREEIDALYAARDQG